MNDQTPFNSGLGTPPPPPPQATIPPPPPPWAYPRRRDGFWRRCFRGLGMLIFIVSIVLNVYLLAALAVMTETGEMGQAVLRPGNDHEVVAVYRLTGVIDDKAVEQFHSFYKDVVHNGDVKAVVLRVDSPGGAVSSADEIHAMVKDLQTTGKTLVVSMGGVAASGGYYVSAPADEIYAEPTTITGSIGVLMAWLVVQGTLDKIGMEAVVIKSSDAEGWKDAISGFHLPDERQRANLKALLDTMHARFEQVVREGRGDRLQTREVTYTVTVGTGPEAYEVERTDIAPLNGQVYLPDEAMELGLIDAIGYEDAAIDRAGELAELAEPKVVVYERRRGLLERMLEGRGPANVKLGPELLDELQSPRFLMLWRAD